MTQFILNENQINVLNQFKQFMDSDNQVFILTGYAGTGKTTMVKEMVRYLGSLSQYPVVLMAPTGRASIVLSRKTGCQASTIHSVIYGKRCVDSDGKMHFELKCNDYSLRTVYFVDEASMISELPTDNDMFHFGSGALLPDLMTFCQGRKVVFIGDNAQLPPVGQSCSPALDADGLARRYGVKVSQAFLTQVVRQDNSGLIYTNAFAIRNSLESGTYNRFSIIEGNDVCCCSNPLDHYLGSVDGKVDAESIIITYTNALALTHNRKIREVLMPGTDRLQPGDRLMVARNHYCPVKPLYNGTFVNVLACEPDSMVECRTVSFFGKKCPGSDKAEIKHVDIAFRDVTIEDDFGGIYQCKILDSFLDDDEGTMDLELNQALTVDFKNRCKAEGVDDDHCAERASTDPYLNALVCKYGYAITCHKSQGGEWNNVFVDMSDVSVGLGSDFFRWVYTAVTRSDQRLWVGNAPRYDLLSEMLVLPVARGGKMVYYSPDGSDFINYRYARLQELCRQTGINCIDDRSCSNQHRVRFTDVGGEVCVMSLWYGKSGYTGKDVVLKCQSPTFAQTVAALCRQSLMVEGDPFVCTCDRESQLHAFVKEVAQHAGMHILNVERLPYVDRYYFTDGANYQVVSFSYNKKEQYSSCTLLSSAGDADSALLLFKSMVEAETNKL